jgi:hypothetical protein
VRQRPASDLAVSGETMATVPPSGSSSCEHWPHPANGPIAMDAARPPTHCQQRRLPTRAAPPLGRPPATPWLTIESWWHSGPTTIAHLPSSPHPLRREAPARASPDHRSCNRLPRSDGRHDRVMAALTSARRTRLAEPALRLRPTSAARSLVLILPDTAGPTRNRPSAPLHGLFRQPQNHQDQDLSAQTLHRPDSTARKRPRRTSTTGAPQIHNGR